MRPISSLHPTEGIPIAPDTMQTLLIAGSSGQAVDWPSTATYGQGSIVRFTGLSTAGAQLNFHVNLESTKAAAPSSGTSTQGTTFSNPVMGQGTFQVPRGSTGWSVAALSSGYVMAEIWSR